MTITKQLLWLAAILVFVLVVYGISTIHPQSPQTPVSTSNLPLVPPPSASDTIAAQTGHDFQFLVSYTDRGFEPTNTTVKAGDTVRFTNNSHQNVWVTSDTASGSLYPSTSNDCAVSAFDSCEPIAPQQSWQFTFTSKGTWSFHNEFDTGKTGVIHVQ